VRRAVNLLDIDYAVVVDTEYDLWEMYGTEGWPARYLWNQEGRLAHFHYGEGAYAETEQAVQELLGIENEPVVAPVRPEDAAGVLLPAQSEDRPGPYSGPYEAGGVWAVLEGRGEARANGLRVAVEGPGCYPLLKHHHHTRGELSLELDEGVTCHAVCFTPGRTP
jgi:hypothetical protein